MPPQNIRENTRAFILSASPSEIAKIESSAQKLNKALRVGTLANTKDKSSGK